MRENTLKTGFFLFALFLFKAVFATDFDALESMELELAGIQNEMREAKSDEDRSAANDRFAAVLKSALQEENAFDYPFEKLRMFHKISEDEIVRIFNWNTSTNDGGYAYFGIVLVKDPKTKLVNLIELTQNKKKVNKIEVKTLDAEHWPGALYYDIVSLKKGKRTYYTLLGWDGNDRLTSKKILDVMTLQGGKPKFGASIFKTEKGIQKRYILEFANEVQVALRWEEKDKRIVFDHLAPRAEGLEGNAAFYGPDFTYDAFVMEKGKWVLKENVVVRQDKSKKDNRPFREPRPERRK